MKEIRLNDIKSLAHTTWNYKYHVVFNSIKLFGERHKKERPNVIINLVFA